MKRQTSRQPKSVTYANRSVLVGVSLVRTLAGLGGPATLQDIANASGMLAARTHRYLMSLVESGLIEHDRETGKYELGALVIELGLAALGRIDAVRVGSDALFQLTSKIGNVSMLTVWGSNGPTVVKCEQGRPAGVVRVREGANLPLLTSATGRIFLSYMPSFETHNFIKRELKRASSGNGKDVFMSPAEIKSMCNEVRQIGLARNLGVTGHDALAAPVFNYEKKLCMVMTVLAPSGTMDTSFEGKIAGELKAAADNLSRRLGGRPDTVGASIAA